jgi:hypothetical protein
VAYATSNERDDIIESEGFGQLIKINPNWKRNPGSDEDEQHDKRTHSC